MNSNEQETTCEATPSQEDEKEEDAMYVKL